MASLSQTELTEVINLYHSLNQIFSDAPDADEVKALRDLLVSANEQGKFERDEFGIHPMVRGLRTVMTLCDKVSPDLAMSFAVLAHILCANKVITPDDVVKLWGDDVARMVRGLINIDNLYSRHPSVGDDNFSRLLMAFADDIRVIIIMIADRRVLMQAINHYPDEQAVRRVANEAGYLYAPLAHRLGLYGIKSDLEDMSLKYTNRETYTAIARKLNQTKVKRDKYIADFINPVKKKLTDAGLRFEIKGRTKSIYSIWNKIKKQKVDLDHIYDLFAIRIIIDTPLEREKSDCWMAYSLITDMFQPNPSRMKDWISIPKSNGYESLHITVAGPEGRWVEVQIRTRRMDLVAEKGLAAHWRYKGVKSEGEVDKWMNNVRDILESAQHGGPLELMRNFKMNMYDEEVFVFTPKGDLFRMPKGATLLDFAFAIHSKIGCTCTGGRVDGKHQKINYRLHSGDTVEINTSTSQTPKLDWLNFAVTSKARSKIRQSVNEQNMGAANLAKETLLRRLKNRKIEYDEAVLMRTVKKSGYRTVTDFFNDMAREVIDVNTVIDRYLELITKTDETQQTRSAEEFTLHTGENDNDMSRTSDDVLVIGQGNVRGLNYRLSKCCNPIYGDDVFGFISTEGVIKIHRTDCPNAKDICRRYPYRIIRTRWSGKLGEQFGATLNVLGNDDIGIITNITSLINKEKNVSLRNISIDSAGGLFKGYLIVGVSDVQTLDNLIKKLKTLKGVKDVQRNN